MKRILNYIIFCFSLFCSLNSNSQCAPDYVDVYGIKGCSETPEQTNYFGQCFLMNKNTNQFIIYNFASVPNGVIGCEDTIIGTINCLTDTISLNTVSYPIWSGELIYSGYGIAYDDSIKLYMHQINPSFEQDLCYTYVRGVTLSNDSKYEKPKKLTIFPNPTEDIVNLDFSGINIQKISLVGIDGKLIRQIDGNTQKIDVSYLPKGTYILRVLTIDQEVFNQNVIKL